MQVTKAYLNWSGGKDAAMALFELQKQKEISVQKLVTTVDAATGKVSMHGLRKELLEQQALQLDLPLYTIALPESIALSDYNRQMKQEIARLAKEGFSVSVFGDIFLEDLREYRENLFKDSNVQPIFPLWKKETGQLMKDFLKAGFKAITVSVNAGVLDRSFCGRVIDEKFLSDLPPGVDPAGENGEFHTFVFDGPLFASPVEFSIGGIREKSFSSTSGSAWDSQFWYCDLLRRQ